jgi:hypothetical protein
MSRRAVREPRGRVPAAVCVLLTAGTVTLVACGDHGGSSPADGGVGDGPTGDAGPSCTTARWDPALGDIDIWPDARLVVDDATTETGRRLRVDPGVFGALLERAAGYRTVLEEDLWECDGFGINAELFFRFDRAFDVARLPDAEATARPGAGVGIVVVDGPGEPAPRFIPAALRLTDDGRTLRLAPLFPLPARATVAAFVTRELTEAAGGCLEPSSAMAARLAVLAGDDARAIAALRDLGVIEDAAADLVALTVFPTQSVVEDSVAVAADIATRSFALDGPATCTADASGRWVQCEAAFIAWNYRDAEGHFPPRARGTAVTPRGTYRLPLTVWLPPATVPRRGPFPALVYGHGLSDGRRQGARLAEFAAPRGIATVAIDAVQHGQHPTVSRPDPGALETVLSFFALRTSGTVGIDARALRDNFRQSTWDKLQLTRLLGAGLDVDGDGAVDIDPARVGYLGVSLGGIMGPELLALTDAYGAAVLVVPGGRVSSIISDSETFGPLIRVARPRGVSQGDVDRFFPILQTVIDRGDAASYAPHVLADRLPGAGRSVPSVLVGVVLDDDTVPNVSNYALARAFPVDVVPPVLRPEPGLRMAPAAPVRGNIASGTATAGLLQFDVVRLPDGRVETATHANVGASEVGVRAWLHFLETHWNEGLAEILDPYEATGLAHRTP